MKKIKVIEYGIDEGGLLGVYAISVVEQPAIGVDFVALSEICPLLHKSLSPAYCQTVLLTLPTTQSLSTSG